MDLRRTVVASLAVLVVGAACDQVPGLPAPEPQACTEIGCESALTFALTDADLRSGVAYDVEICVDRRCERGTVEAPADEPGAVGNRVGGLWIDTQADEVSLVGLQGDHEGTHDVTLRVAGPDGQVVADVNATTEFQRTQPNGPRCPPVCWQARLQA